MSEVKSDVIGEALRIVTGERRAAYGKPEDNFARIARYWNVRLVNTGRAGNLTAIDVAVFMELMKQARLDETPTHRDSIVDKIGYVACYAELALGAGNPG